MPRKGKGKNKDNDKVQGYETPRIGLPTQQLVKFRYASYQEHAGTDGAFEYQVVRAGSPYDPDATGVGHQAMGFDQWAAFYKNYIVVRSKITVTVTLASSITVPPMVGVYLSAESSPTGTNWFDMVEQGKSVYKMIPLSVAVPVSKLVSTYDAKKAFNLTDVKDNETRIGAAFSANPADEMYFIIWTQALTTAVTAPVKFTYVVDYDCIVSQPLELPSS